MFLLWQRYEAIASDGGAALETTKKIGS